MNKLFFVHILLAFMVMILGACAATDLPTQELAQVESSVKINSSYQEGEVVEINLDGQTKTITLWAEATPTNASFEWQHTGSGELTSTTDPSIQYIAPQIIDGQEDVVVTVIMKHPETDQEETRDQIIIRLLPPTPTPIPTGTPTPVPPTATPTPTPTQQFIGTAVTITDPPNGGKAECPAPVPELCFFTVRGTSSGVSEELVIRFFVQPVNPPSEVPGARFVQAQKVRPDSDGSWETSLQIGNPQYPAHTGDTLKMVAWVVNRTESEKLDQTLGRPIDPESEASYVARSSEIDLVVERIESSSTDAPNADQTPSASVSEPQTPSSGHPVYVGSTFAEGYDMGINTSGGLTNWVSEQDGSICMAYPGNQAWGAVFITVGQPTDPPRPSTDLSNFQTLSLELRGEEGDEYVSVGLKDNADPDNGTEIKKVVSNLTMEWQTFTFSLADFETADLTRLYVVTEFVFEPGTPGETICFRNIQYLP